MSPTPEESLCTGQPDEPGRSLSPQDQQLWESVLRAGARAQQIVPGAVAVGGTAAALYAKHRLSLDTDHWLPGLTGRFDEVLDALSAVPEWKTARIRRPVLILGNIEAIQVGFRQPRRTTAIETTTIRTSGGDLVIPTLAEMIGIKAFLAYVRNATRDYLDFAALTTCTTQPAVLKALLELDDQYAGFQTDSIRLEVAKALADPRPYDLEQTDLSHYKALAREWHDWHRVVEICRTFGILLSGHLVTGGGS